MSDEPLDLSKKSCHYAPDTQSGLHKSVPEPTEHDGENGVNGSFGGLSHAGASPSSTEGTISSNGHSPSRPPAPNTPREQPNTILQPDLSSHPPSFSTVFSQPTCWLDSIKASKAMAAKYAEARAEARKAKAKAAVAAKAAAAAEAAKVAAAAAVSRDDTTPASSIGHSPSCPPIPTNSPDEPAHKILRLKDLPPHLPSSSNILVGLVPLATIQAANAAATAVPRDDTKHVSSNGQSPSCPPVPTSSPQEPPHIFLRPKDVPPHPPSSSNNLVRLVPLASMQTAIAAAAARVSAAATARAAPDTQSGLQNSLPEPKKHDGENGVNGSFSGLLHTTASRSSTTETISSNGHRQSCPPVHTNNPQVPLHIFLRPHLPPPLPYFSNIIFGQPLLVSINTANAAARAAPDTQSGLQNSLPNEPIKHDGENGVNGSFSGLRHTTASHSSSTETISSNRHPPSCPPVPVPTNSTQEPPHAFLRPYLPPPPPYFSNMVFGPPSLDSINATKAVALRAAAARGAAAAREVIAIATAAEAAVARGAEAAVAAVPRDDTQPVSSEEQALNAHFVPIRPLLMPHVHPHRAFSNPIVGTGNPLTPASANLPHFYPNPDSSLRFSNLTISAQKPHIVPVPRKRRAETTNGSSSNGISCASNRKIRHRTDDQSVSSDGNNSESCAGKHSESCAGKHSESCAGNNSESCAENNSESYAGNNSELCAGNNSGSCALSPASEEDSANCQDEGRNPSTSEVKKDAAYWERRKKNNESAKRSRDSRRERVGVCTERLVQLEQEHTTLITEVAILTHQVETMRQLLIVKECGPQSAILHTSQS